MLFGDGVSVEKCCVTRVGSGGHVVNSANTFEVDIPLRVRLVDESTVYAC